MKLLCSILLVVLVASFGDCEHEHHRLGKKIVHSKRELPSIQDFNKEIIGNTVVLDMDDVVDLYQVIVHFLMIIDEIINSGDYDIPDITPVSSIPSDAALPNAQSKRTAPVAKLRTLRKQLQDIREDISNTNGNNIQDLKDKIETALESCSECMTQIGKSTRVAKPHKARTLNNFRKSYAAFAEAAGKCIGQKPSEGSKNATRSASSHLKHKKKSY